MGAGRTAAIALILAAAPIARVAAQGDTLEVVIAIEIPGAVRHVLLARALDDRLLLPVRTLLDLARIRVDELQPGHRILATIEPSGQIVVFDTDRGQVRGWNGSAALRLDSAAWTDDELYVVAGALEVALGVQVVVDWSDLVVRINGADHLPAVQLARRANRPRLPQRAAPTAPTLDLADPPLFDGGVLDWSYVTPSSDLFSTSSIGLGLGLTAIGGSLTVDESLGITTGTTSSRLLASWRRAWATGIVRQVGLGDATLGALRSQFVTGATVTNAPFQRSPQFGLRAFQRTVPAGWSVEIYSAGALVDIVNAPPSGDLAAIDLPLRYGSNPVELVLLGPFGERLVERTEVFVPQLRLPAGQIEYAVGGGACRFADCQAAGSADLRWAPRGWVTLESGIETTWRDTVPDLTHPFARVSVAPHTATNLTVTAAWDALASAELLVAPSTDLQVSLAGSLFDEGTPQPVLQPPGTARQAEGAVFWRPPLPGNRLYLRVSGTAATGTGGQRRNLGGTVGFRLAGGLLTVNMLTNRIIAAVGTTISTTLARLTATRNLPGPGKLRGVFLQASVQTTDAHAFDAARFSISRRLGSRLRAEVASGWSATSRAQVGITVTTTLPMLRATNSVDIRGDGTVAGLQSFEGSVLWDTRTSEVALGPGRALGLAGVTGDVFLDVNANGQRDPDEEGVADVWVAVGGRRILTDMGGRYRTWDLTPFETTLLQLDTLSVANPLLVPLRVRGSFTASPNAFRRVDIPFVAGAEVSGTVVRENGRPAGGMTIELIADDGTVRHRGTSFADGSFYFLGVAPGTWQLRIASSLLDQLGAHSEPVVFEVPLTPDGTAVTDLQVTFGT